MFRSQLAVVSAVAKITNREQLKPRFGTRLLVVDQFKRSGELTVESTRDLVDYPSSVFQSEIPTLAVNLFFSVI